MKKTKRQLIKGTNWALAGLMGLLGFACSDEEIAPEYGTPHADYRISGYVKNQSGEPIPDIKIEAVTTYNSDFRVPVLSNSQGYYNATASSVGRVGELQLIVTDIDKEKNGLFQNDTILIKIDDKDYYDKGEGWNVGKAFKEVDITLKNVANE